MKNLFPLFSRKPSGEKIASVFATGLRAACLTLFAIFASANAFAVKVYISGDATVTGGASCEIVLGEEGAGMDSAGNIDGSAVLVPGKTYQLSLNATGISNATLNLRPAGNFQVVIDGSAKRQIQVFNADPAQVITEVFDVEIRAIGGSTSPGGDTGVSTGSEIAWGVGLGRLYNGSPAGNLVIRSSALDDSVFDRRLLSYSGVNQQVFVVVDIEGKITQILAPETFVTVTDNHETGGFDIAFYPLAAVGQRHPSGVFDLNPGVSDYVTYYIAPDTQPDNEFGFTVVRLEGSHLLTTSAAYGAGTWMKDMGDQLSVEERLPVETGEPGRRAEMITIQNGNGVVAKKTKRVYQAFAWNNPNTQLDELVQEIQDPDGKAYATTYDYYTNRAEGGSYGRVKSITYPDGSWVKYEYYSDPSLLGREGRTGMVSKEYRPWLDAPASPDSAAPGTGHVIDYDYTLDWYGNKTILSSRTETINGVVVGKMTATAAVGQTFNNLKAWTYTRTLYASATETLTTVTKSYQTNQADADALFNGLPISIGNPDGTKVSYAYQRGSYDGNTFTPSNDGTAMREIEITGLVNASGVTSMYDTVIDAIGLVANRSTATMRIRRNGRLMRESSAVYNGSSFEEISWVAYAYNEAGRLVRRDNSNGTSYEAAYDGSFKVSETDETGIHQTFEPDALQRVAMATKTGVLASTDAGYAAQAGVQSNYLYDAAGRVVMRQRHGSNDGTMQETTAYDLSGRAVSHTNVDGYTSTATETRAAGGGLRRTVMPACGGTVVTEYHRDGRPSSVSGDAVVGQRYVYAVDPQTGFITTTVYSGPSTATGAWNASTQDWLGRARQTSEPGPNGGILTSSITYNDRGQMARVTRSGSAPMIYEYDAMGALIQSGLAVSNPAATSLTPASADRITAQTAAFAKIDGSWWLVATRTAPLANNSAVFTTLSTTRTRLTGFSAGKIAETETIDAGGNTMTSYLQVDPEDRLVYEVTRTPVSSISAERVYYNGLLVEEIGSGGQTIKYAYDTLGRLSLTTPQKTKAVRTLYNQTSAGFATTQVWQTQFENADGSTGTLIARYAYDSAGRVVCVTDASGATVRSAYDCRKQLTHRWGSGTQPVSYTYDAFGRLATQSTHRDPFAAWDGAEWPGGTTADTTTFEYYGDLPLPLRRTDAAGNAVLWEYDDYGRLVRTTNARGQEIDLAYDAATGELTSKTVPIPGSASRASTTFTYNRVGQITTIEDPLGTRSYAYGGASGLDLISETLPAYYDSKVGGQYKSRRIAYAYETAPTGIPGRFKGFTLGVVGASSPEVAYAYSYTDIGTMNAITASGGGQAERTFVYDYDASARWLMTGMHLDGVSETLRRTVTYDETFGTVKSIDTTWLPGAGANPVSFARYDYTHDDRGLRSTARQSGAFYSDYGGDTYYRYGYNARGELTSARQYLGGDVSAENNPLPGRQYGYAYDAMGNRLSARRTTLPDSDLDEHYESNNLNQIVEKENKSVPLSGTMLEGGRAVAAGSGVLSTSAHKGRFWNIEMLLDNAQHAAKAGATLHFGKAKADGNTDAFATFNRAVFQRKADETFEYDNDGNLISDGLWDYTYDAENRLVAMQTHDALNETLAGVAGEPQPRKLTFAYDHMGRRVGKTVHGRQGTEWLPEKIIKFAYDGWNLVAEYDAMASDSCPLLTAYTWGLDGAGSLTATAGVGALLMIQNGGNTYYPAFDGNGNVAGLLDKDGNAAAAYEYSPYGELTRIEGPSASKNAIRQGSQYNDSETGLVYSGGLYYSPRLGRAINKGGVDMPSNNIFISTAVASPLQPMSSKFISRQSPTEQKGEDLDNEMEFLAHRQAGREALIRRSNAIIAAIKAGIKGWMNSMWTIDSHYIQQQRAKSEHSGGQGNIASGAGDEEKRPLADNKKLAASGGADGVYDPVTDKFYHSDGRISSFNVILKEMEVIGYISNYNSKWYNWNYGAGDMGRFDPIKSDFVWAGSQAEANFNRRWEVERAYNQALRNLYGQPEYRGSRDQQLFAAICTDMQTSGRGQALKAWAQVGYATPWVASAPIAALYSAPALVAGAQTLMATTTGLAASPIASTTIKAIGFSMALATRTPTGINTVQRTTASYQAAVSHISQFAQTFFSAGPPGP